MTPDESIEAFAARITRHYAPGDRVRARIDISYLGQEQVEVGEGDLGTVAPDDKRRFFWPIEWDRHPGVKCWTSADLFDPAPS